MNKKFWALLLSLALCLSLAACGGDSSDAADSSAAEGSAGETAETVKLSVAASPTPHAVILEQCVPILAEQGIELVVNEYSDYVVPNTAVEDGDEDANYFQHIPYLDEFNETRGTHLVSVAGVHIEPMGIYAGKTASIEELADGAVIAVPNDATNEGRALLLLEAQGLIKLNEGVTFTATKLDIAENPKNLDIVELEANQLPVRLADVDMAVINGNYAIDAGLKVADAVAIEAADGEAATAYVNVLAVKEGNEDSPAIQALAAALTSQEVKDFIDETYAGAVVPVF